MFINKNSIAVSIISVIIVCLAISYKSYLYKDEKRPRYIQVVCEEVVQVDNRTYNGCGGWADRLKGIMSAYALSLVTDRELIIDFNHPCELENYILPNEIQWNRKINKNVENEKKLTYFQFPVFWNFGLINLIKRAKDLNEYWQEADVVVIRIQVDCLKALSKNINYQQKIKDLGYKISEFRLEKVFKTWYKKLFKFTPELQEIYENSMKSFEKTNKDTKIICAQIRMGGNQLKDPTFKLPKDLTLFWEFLKTNITDNIIDNNYKVFITSDNPDILNNTEHGIDENKIIFNQEASIHTDRTENKNNYGPYIDFDLLSQCDGGIMSHSGFGFLALLNNNNDKCSDFYVWAHYNGRNIVNNYGLQRTSYHENRNPKFTFKKFDLSWIYIDRLQ